MIVVSANIGIISALYRNRYDSLNAKGIYGRPKPMSILKLNFLPMEKQIGEIWKDGTK